MLGDLSLFNFIALFVAAGAGAWAATRLARQRQDNAQSNTRLSPDYFKGINYILNEQPDKAIEVFIRMAEVDNETVETHFALGSLFRRRGEVDRAIRIHQNIIARPNLEKKQREQALFALAADYQTAGLFDRAEKLFLQLSALPGHRQAAMRRLVRIYEQQKDWNQAIAIRKQLGDTSGSRNDGGVAHAYCEMAQRAIDKNDLESAKQHLRKAKVDGNQFVRAAYMRAMVAQGQNDHKLVVRLCKWIIEHDESFTVEVLPLLMRSLEVAGNQATMTKTLQSLLTKNQGSFEPLALAALAHNLQDNEVLLEAIRQFVEHDPFASKLSHALESSGSHQAIKHETMLNICDVLRELILRRAKYECRECGYSGNVLNWQCPSCKNWDSTRPIVRLLEGNTRSSRF